MALRETSALARLSSAVASPLPPERFRQVAWGFLAGCLLVRLVLLAVDSQPRFFFGDSQSYLATRLGFWIPPDRSWLYGLGASWIIDTAGRLGALIVVQSVATAASTALVGVALIRAGLAPVAVAPFLLAASLEPFGLFYDRAVLTDSPGAALLAAGFACALVALRNRSPRLALAAAAMLAGAVALRTALLPPVLWVVVVGGAAALRPGHAGTAEESRRKRQTGLVLALATLAGLAAYSIATGKATHRPVSLNPNGGFFLLGAIAPLLQPEDFGATGLPQPEVLLAQTHHRDRFMRNAQLYGPGEIVDRLKGHFGDERRAAGAAGTAARAAILRDPAGYLQLVIAQAAEYLRPGLYRAQFHIWAGLDTPIPDSLVTDLRKRVRDAPPAAIVEARSLALDYLDDAAGAFPVLAWTALLVPLLCILRSPFASAGDRQGLLLVAGATLAYAGGIFAFSAEMVPRYLLPFASLLTLGLGLLAASLSRIPGAPGAQRPVAG